jgi:hypothetical protein
MNEFIQEEIGHKGKSKNLFYTLKEHAIPSTLTGSIVRDGSTIGFFVATEDGTLHFSESKDNFYEGEEAPSIFGKLMNSKVVHLAWEKAPEAHIVVVSYEYNATSKEKEKRKSLDLVCGEVKIGSDHNVFLKDDLAPYKKINVSIHYMFDHVNNLLDCDTANQEEIADKIGQSVAEAIKRSTIISRLRSKPSSSSLSSSAQVVNTTISTIKQSLPVNCQTPFIGIL